MVSEDVCNMFPYSRHILQLLHKQVEFLESLSLSFMTQDMCDFTTHPLVISSENDECNKLFLNLVIKAYSMCTLKLNILDNWDSGTVTVEQVFLPEKEAKDVLFVKLTHKKLNYKDVVTDYVSSIQCAILLDHISIVINDGLSKPYTVSKVGHIPPSFSAMFALIDWFNVVFCTNTYNCYPRIRKFINVRDLYLFSSLL